MIALLMPPEIERQQTPAGGATPSLASRCGGTAQNGASSQPASLAGREIDSAIRERVRARTRELAWLAGRSPADVSQVDYEQAKREVTGESDPDRQEAKLVDRHAP